MIPLRTVVVDAIAAHLVTFLTEGLILTNTSGDPIGRSNFGYATAGHQVGGPRKPPLPRPAHYYVSLLIRHGESVKTVQARLGHANAAEPWTPTATCGRTPTTVLVRPWIWSWEILLRTPCGLRPAAHDKRAGQWPISG